MDMHEGLAGCAYILINKPNFYMIFTTHGGLVCCNGECFSDVNDGRIASWLYNSSQYSYS